MDQKQMQRGDVALVQSVSVRGLIVTLSTLVVLTGCSENKPPAIEGPLASTALALAVGRDVEVVFDDVAATDDFADVEVGVVTALRVGYDASWDSLLKGLRASCMFNAASWGATSELSLYMPGLAPCWSASYDGTLAADRLLVGFDGTSLLLPEGTFADVLKTNNVAAFATGVNACVAEQLLLLSEAVEPMSIAYARRHGEAGGGQAQDGGQVQDGGQGGQVQVGDWDFIAPPTPLSSIPVEPDGTRRGLIAYLPTPSEKTRTTLRLAAVDLAQSAVISGAAMLGDDACRASFPDVKASLDPDPSTTDRRLEEAIDPLNNNMAAVARGLVVLEEAAASASKSVAGLDPTDGRSVDPRDAAKAHWRSNRYSRLDAARAFVDIDPRLFENWNLTQLVSSSAVFEGPLKSR